MRLKSAFFSFCLALSASLLLAGCLGGSSPRGGSPQAAPVERPAWQLIYTDISFADPSLGLISGWQGTILRSADAGLNWVPAKVDSRADINSVAVLKTGAAVAVGSGGTILLSTDSGQTWDKVESPTTKTLNDVSAVTGDAVVAVGWQGTVIRSLDGGRTWTPYGDSIDPSLNIEAVDFSEDGAGIAVSSSGLAFSTADAGATWQPATLPDQGLKLFAVDLLDNQTAYVAGNLEAERSYMLGGKSAILRSDDGGKSWSMGPSFMNTDFLAVRLLDAQNVIAAGWNGELWRSRDGGESWQKIVSPTNRAIRAIGAADESTLVAVGDGQTIIISRNGGLDWEKVRGV